MVTKPNTSATRWVFTWNADEVDFLPEIEALKEKLSEIAKEGVFQLEKGGETGRLHYQGRFVCKTGRKTKQNLLKQFSEIFSTEQLTLAHEIAYDSSSYCTKDESRMKGPFWVGTSSYILEKEGIRMTLRNWQQQFLEMIQDRAVQRTLRDRKVIVVSNPSGGSGKSLNMKWLATNEKTTGIKVAKLPIDKPDRIRSAVTKLMKKQDIDLFMFDFTKTMGEDTHLENLFEVVEDIKNGYVVDCMYGQYNHSIFHSPMVVIFTNKHFRELDKYLSEDRWFRLYVRDKDDPLSYWRPCGTFSDGETQYEGDHKLFVSEIEKMKKISNTN